MTTNHEAAAREWLANTFDGCPDCTKMGEPFDCDVASLARAFERVALEAKIEVLNQWLDKTSVPCGHCDLGTSEVCRCPNVEGWVFDLQSQLASLAAKEGAGK